MKPVALKLFGRLLVGFFLVAFGHGTQAQNASASDAAVLAPPIKARVESLNRSYAGASVTTYSNLQGFLPQGTWNKILVRGRAITMDALGALRLNYETCESGTLVQRQKKSNPIFMGRSSCTADGDWKAHKTEYRLVAINPQTIGVREESAPAGPNWFEIGFSGVDAAQSGRITCPGRQACESMAEDLRGLVTVSHALRDSLARINQAYSGLVFQQASKQGEPRIVVVKMEAVRANFETMHTLQQVCVRRPDQDCDRDKLWRERMALADVSKLALEVTLDEARNVSDDKAVGVAIVKCVGEGCWGVRIGGSGGNIRSGSPTDAIHCRIGDGCRQMKRELEQLVALLQGKGPVSDAPPDAFAKPSLRLQSGPIWVKMETDGTIVVQDAPPHSMQTIGQPPRRTFPPSHPHYNYVLRTLGPFTPGDDFRPTLAGR
jgi:hypothetical protein